MRHLSIAAGTALVTLVAVGCATAPREPTTPSAYVFVPVPGNGSPEHQAAEAEREAYSAFLAADWPIAAAWMERALELNPAGRAQPERLTIFTLSLVNMGRCEEALKLLPKASHPDLARARCLGEAGDWPAAIEASRSHLRAYPDDVEARLLVSDLQKATAGAFSKQDVADRAEARAIALLAQWRLDRAWSEGKTAVASPLEEVESLRCAPGRKRLAAAERRDVDAMLEKAFALDRGCWVAAYVRACLHFDAASPQQPLAERAGEIRAGLDVLSVHLEREAERGALHDLNREWTSRLRDVLATGEAQERFQLVARSQTTGPKASGEAPLHFTVAAQLVTPLFDDDERCVLEIDDDAEIAGLPPLMRVHVIGAFSCPWQDGSLPQSDVEVVAVNVGVSRRITRAGLNPEVIELRATAIRHGSTIRAAVQ